MSRMIWPMLGLACGLIAIQDPATGAVADNAPDKKEFTAVIGKAKEFLKTVQGPDGSFAPKFGGPGITSIIVAGLIRSGYEDDPIVTKALAYLEKAVQPDGGIYQKQLQNYTTCLGIMAFQDANDKGKYKTIIANASKYLKSLQAPGEPDDPKSGGVGYGDGKKDRPDLSNTHYFVEALIASGVPKDDPAITRALLFVGRCQNLPGESNSLPYAKKTSDGDRGGFVYNPTSEPGPNNPKSTPMGGLRSEGGMTYAGLKSFLFAGVAKDDPRVRAAVKWVREHYTLDENPGQKDSGLFYYYHTFAKAMDALGEDPFEDAKGVKHYWRKELFEALKERQNANGSWTNANKDFLENLPELSTAFAILSLSYTQKK